MSENAIVQQAYNKSQEMISQASEEAAEIRSSAESDSATIRNGALNYANEIMSDMERLLADAFNNTKRQAEGLINALNDSYTVVAANRKELTTQLNPQEAYAFDDPIASVSDDDDILENYNENTFLEGIEESFRRNKSKEIPDSSIADKAIPSARVFVLSVQVRFSSLTR